MLTPREHADKNKLRLMAISDRLSATNLRANGPAYISQGQRRQRPWK
jgi:hypothetical protein